MDKIADAVNSAFAGDASIRKRIFDAINDTPQYVPLFGDIARYTLDQRSSADPGASSTPTDSQPSKKRRLENGAAAMISTPAQPRDVILEARDISFQLPQRKKLHLSIVQYGQNFHDPSTTFSLCIRNPASNQIEYEYPMTTFEHTLCLLVPEKVTKQLNYCFLPSSHSENEAVQLLPGEGVIWTVNHGPLKSCSITSPDLKATVSDPSEMLFQALDAVLKRSGQQLTKPTETEFACAVPEAHRKNEKAYHVKAHRGSKDGYLWFLSTGIFFGFKKPLAFFPFHHIESVSYTAVLQRTFNLVVIVSPDPKSEPQEIEFSMLDQAEFAGIDGYIKKHQLQDASMAEVRKAKQFGVNGKQAVDGGDGVGELEKAEQEAIDEEDEMEEDYDPDEDGDSDGSGSSEDNEEESYAENGRNLVEEELGSEAEEVEIDEDEEGDQEEEEEEEEDVKNPPPVKATKVPERIKDVAVKKDRQPEPDFDDEDQL